MSKHIRISSDEFADRLAIRELVEAYAHCADRRDAQGQMSLFTTDTRRKEAFDGGFTPLPGHIGEEGRHMAVLRSACSLSTGGRSAHYHNH